MEKNTAQPIESAPAPMELLAQGAAIVKMENTVQMRLAIERPRDESKILAAALRELDIYPSMAREAIYNKPVGKDDKGEMKYVEGLSIRAAESLANRWSNSSWGATITAEDEESATIAAVFLDYEANTRHVKERRVSKFYRSKSGQITRYAPDRFSTILDANGSKNLREVILRSLSAGLKKEYETKARNILSKEPIAAQRQAIIERFADLGITSEQLEAWKKKPLKEWKKPEIMEALGLVNALRDGETTIEEVFGHKNGDKKPEAEKPGLKLTPPGEQTAYVLCPDLPQGEKRVKSFCETKCSKKEDCPGYKGEI